MVGPVANANFAWNLAWRCVVTYQKAINCRRKWSKALKKSSTITIFVRAQYCHAKACKVLVAPSVNVHCAHRLLSDMLVTNDFNAVSNKMSKCDQDNILISSIIKQDTKEVLRDFDYFDCTELEIIVDWLNQLRKKLHSKSIQSLFFIKYKISTENSDTLKVTNYECNYANEIHCLQSMS